MTAGVALTDHGAASVFSWRDGLAYGALGLPVAFLALPLYVSLPHHYAVQHGLPLALLGAVLLGTRLLDAAADPFIGQLADRRFRAGSTPVRRWMAAAGAVLAIGFAWLFLSPTLPRPFLVGGLLLVLPLTYLAFSLLTVLHQAWGTRLGGDEARRARIVAWREGFGLAGVMLASVLPVLAGFAAATVVLAACLGLGLLLMRLAPSPDPFGSAPPPPHASAGWALPWTDRRFRGLLAVFVINGTASAVPATLVLFFVQDRLQASDWAPAFLAAYFAAAALSLPAWLRMVPHLGLGRAWLSGMLLAVLAFAGASLLGPGDGVAFMAVCIASGVALGADLAVPGALLNGVVQRGPSGLHGAGVYAGWWTAAAKLNLGLAAGAALPVLAWAGYVPGSRDTDSLQVLTLAYVGLPCVLKLLAAGALWRWSRSPEGNLP